MLPVHAPAPSLLLLWLQPLIRGARLRRFLLLLLPLLLYRLLLWLWLECCWALEPLEAEAHWGHRSPGATTESEASPQAAALVQPLLLIQVGPPQSTEQSSPATATALAAAAAAHPRWLQPLLLQPRTLPPPLLPWLQRRHQW